jgi:glycosyltransferase involved in cell wall biosynthesis
VSASRRSIVCFSNLDWDFLRYRKQHLMSRLARWFDVVYVNPPRAIKARTPGRWNRVYSPEEHLWVLDPLVLPGVRYAPAIKRLNDRLIARAIARIPRSEGAPIAWAYSPHAISLVDLVNPDFVVYDIADNYTTPGGARVRDAHERREIERLAALQREMLTRADLIFCVSDPLAEIARRLRPDVHVVPNGCDFYAYRFAMVRRGQRPRIGYVGTIAPRFDLELLISVAERNPHWDFEVIGPISPLVSVDTTRTPRNLMWTGEIPYQQVPAAIARFDVGILPLREIPFATDCSPIQVFDYLAAGKPVVSTPVAQLERWPAVVAIARGPAAFSAAIAEALNENSATRIDERRAFAFANSWESRVDQIVDLLSAAGAIPSHRAA